MNNSLAAWGILFGIGFAAMVVLLYVAVKSMVAFNSVLSADLKPVEKKPVVEEYRSPFVVSETNPCSCNNTNQKEDKNAER